MFDSIILGIDTWGGVIKNIPKTWKKLSIFKKIVTLIFLAFILLGSIWFFVDIQLAQHHSSNKKAVDDVLIYLSEENYTDAYSLFADKYKDEEDFDSFKSTIQQIKPAYTSYKANSFTSTRITRFLLPIYPPTLRYIGNISYQDGTQAPVTAIFLQENNEWKLYLLEFN